MKKYLCTGLCVVGVFCLSMPSYAIVCAPGGGNVVAVLA